MEFAGWAIEISEGLRETLIQINFIKIHKIHGKF